MTSVIRHREDPAQGLGALEEALEEDLDRLDYPRRPWVAERRTRSGEPIADVLIVGGGQSGLVAAFALKRERVERVVVIDENPEDRAGPWLTFARMKTLRTPKHMTGPDLGIPNLTIQAWFEAQHGAGAWAKMGLIPKETWAAYLSWYRRVLGIPVQWETRCGRLHWNAAERCWEAPCTAPAGQILIRARRVVLATGIDGSGAWKVPPFIEDAVDRRFYAHTRDEIDFRALRGKNIGVLGAGASAFDNAACALEREAAAVHLFFRRREMVRVNAYRWAEFVGFLRHMSDLPDPQKYRFIRQIVQMGQLPPRDTYERATRLPGFFLHPGTPWTGARTRGSRVEVQTPAGAFEFDFLILGTGFTTDVRGRRELAEVADQLALWSDCFTPPDGQADDELLRHPYLGPSFEHLPRPGVHAPHLAYLHNYTFGCLLSHGFGGASISGLKYSIPRLVGGITRSLFMEDAESHFASLVNFSEEEFE